jgi:diguanylate cyclase (GGDEF)-like protein/PAS domain S-box-containing protein
MLTAASLDKLALFDALMGNNNDSIYFKDLDCRLLRVSTKMASDLGFADPSELIGKDDSELFGEEFGAQTRLDDLRVMEDDRPIVGVIEGRCLPDGKTNWTITSKQPLHDENGAVIGLVGITREINEIRQTEVALQHLATHDSLTGLPNRFLLTDRMNQLLARAGRQKTSFAVLFMDIDNFKGINDAYGHETGDQMLREVADRLQSCVRASDTVARLGGDEFVILLEASSAPQAAEAVALKIKQSLKRSFIIGGNRMKVGMSIGISFHPENEGDAALLLRLADRAMYLAKRSGGNCHCSSLSGLFDLTASGVGSSAR